MPFGITLRLDPVSAAAVEAMWRVPAEAALGTGRRDPVEVLASHLLAD
jgi:hypothetical protein